MRLTLALIALVALTTACSRNTEPSIDKETLLSEAATNFFASLPDTLATVNGSTLTRETALLELDTRAEALRNRLPPGEIEAAKMQILPKVVGAFVTRTLLEQESERRQIEVTETELSNTLARIEQRLGSDVDAFMENSPMGAEHMRNEVIKGMRVERMLKTALSNETQVADAEVDAFIEANRESLTDSESGELMERSKVEHIVRKGKYDIAVKAFIEDLRQKAEITIAPTFKEHNP